MSTSAGNVEIHRYGKVSELPKPLPQSWPDGRALKDMATKHASSASGEPDYWQLSARWALLHKFQLLSFDAPYVKNENESQVLKISDPQRTLIQTAWKRQCLLSDSSDLSELMRTSMSNTRPVEWAVMDIGPGCQFHLHAHASLELVKCLSGELHEIRMNGPAYDIGTKGPGPSLVDCQRSWNFNTLREGQWLVNEVGSIHKSFTATNNSKGCKLLVLWSGGHFDVKEGEEPTEVDVHGTVNAVDDKLSACKCASDWASIPETFLPTAEKALTTA